MAQLNKYAEYLVNAYSKKTHTKTDAGISVNPFVSEIAAWYEKFRNAIDYREEEVILRASIERILKRRLLFGGSAKSIAAPLVRELVWARYFPGNTVEAGAVEKVEETIGTYLSLRAKILESKTVKESELNQWMYHLLSSELEKLLAPNPKKETMVYFIFHTLKDSVYLEDDSADTKETQVFIAIRRTYAKDDLAFLRYTLFKQYFGQVSEKNVEKIAEEFVSAKTEIEQQLEYPQRHRINAFVKRHIPPFLILEEILLNHEDDFKTLVESEEFESTVFAVCQKKYKGIVSKVHRAIMRSVIFILLSKSAFALGVEGTYEKIIYGHIQWFTIFLTIAIPTSFMGASALFITTPGHKNSQLILEHIKKVLFEEDPRLGKVLRLKAEQKGKTSFGDFIFNALWLSTFIVSFGLVVYGLTLLQFNPISIVFFAFFLAIVFFLIYRINQTAQSYTVERRFGIMTPIVDFFFLPIAQTGRYFTEAVSQVNVFLFFLDIIFETPFKGIFAFFEQWLFFLHAKRERLE